MGTVDLNPGLIDRVGADAVMVIADYYPGIDPTGATDCTAAWASLIVFANGRPIRADGRYKVKDLYVADTPINILGSGTFIHQQGYRILMVKRTLGAAQAVSAISEIQIGANNISASSSVGTSTLVTKIAAANAYTFSAGDVVRLDSSDTFPWCTQYSAELGYTINVYHGELLKIYGLGLDYTSKANGGFAQGDTVTGATSGVTATVYAVGNNGSATDQVIFRSASGAFTNGENLLVGGTVRGVVNGSAYLIVPELLTYRSRYTANVAVRKMNAAAFRLDGISIEADSDPDAIVGSSNRVQAILLMGLVDADIQNIRIKSAWTRAIRLQSCWAPKVNGLQIDRIANNANTSESAYGYGIDCCGATAYGTYSRITGGNCRHAFTTNTDGLAQTDIDTGTVSYGTRDHYYDGCPKHNTVRSSSIVGNIAEPFDTHPGDLFTTFEDCTALWGSGTGLNVTAPGGFKTRGFWTRHINCRTIGGTLGFNDYSGLYDAGFSYVQTYQGCEVGRYSRAGFAVTQSPASANQRQTLYDACIDSGGALDQTSPFYPTGWAPFYGSMDVTLRRCRSKVLAGTPFAILASQTWQIEDFTADYRDATGNSSAPRIDGVPANVLINGLTIFRHRTNPSLPAAYIRNSTASAITIQIGNLAATNGTAGTYAELPTVTNTGGGSTTVYFRYSGKVVLQGTAAPTGANPEGRSWQIGDRVENTSPAAAGYMGWVCTTAGIPGTWKGYGAIAA